MKVDQPRRIDRRDYLPSGPERVKRGQANFATLIALLLAVCVVAFLMGLVIAIGIGMN